MPDQPGKHGEQHVDDGPDPIPGGPVKSLRAQMFGHTLTADSPIPDLEWFTGGATGSTAISDSAYFTDPADTGKLEILKPGFYVFQMSLSATYEVEDLYIDGQIQLQKESGTSGSNEALWGNTLDDTIAATLALRLYGGPAGGTDQEKLDVVDSPIWPMLWFTINDLRTDRYPYRVVPAIGWFTNGVLTEHDVNLTVGIARLPFTVPQ